MEALSVEALELIQKTAVEASGGYNKIQVVESPGEPEYVKYFVKPDGSYERIVGQATPRGHRLGSVEDVVSWVDQKGGEKTVVWYNELGCYVVVDDDTRRDRLCLDLQKTEQWMLLESLAESPRPFSQKDFVKFLRVKLHGILADQRLLTFARHAKFSGSSSTGGEVLHGRESLGRTIEGEARGINSEECPDEVQLNVRIFTDPRLQDRQPVNCAVDLDVQTATFSLVPYPLQMQNAMDSEISALGAYLDEQIKQPVFRGQP